MPSFNFKVQGNGRWQLWESFTGADEAYQCIDDSDSTTHDSGTSYILLNRLLFEADGVTPAAGRISFPIMIMAEVEAPLSLTLTVAAAENVAANPRMQIGFYRGGSVGFHATMMTVGGAYSTQTRTFATNPITSAAWTADDLLNLEACIQNEDGVAGSNRISLISGTLTYTKATSWQRPEPVMAVF